MKLKWKIVTGDEKLKNTIERLKETFDKWFYEHWSRKISREKMLSPDSPLPHIYYKMCKTPEEVKKIPLRSTGNMLFVWRKYRYLD